MSGPVPVGNPVILRLLADIERERIEWRYRGRGMAYTHDEGTRVTVDVRRLVNMGLARRCDSSNGRGGTVELTSSGLYHLHSNVVDRLVGVLAR